MTSKTSPNGRQPGKRGTLFAAIQDALQSSQGWKPIQGVVAVHSPSDAPEPARTLDETRLPNLISPVARSRFAEAGWHLVNAEDSLADSDGHELVIDKDGQLKIVGSTLDVKFGQDMTPESIKALLDDCGLAVVQAYDFSRNMFSVKGDHILEKAARLASLDEVEFAEPSLIESIGPR